MKLKNKIYKFLPIILLGLQFNFIFTQSLENGLQKEISEFEKQSKQVFDKNIKSDRCRRVSKSDNTFTINYRDRSGCEKYKNREFYKGSLTSDSNFFNTGVLHKIPLENGNKIKEIYFGGFLLGLSVSRDDLNCLILYAKIQEMKEMNLLTAKKIVGQTEKVKSSDSIQEKQKMVNSKQTGTQILLAQTSEVPKKE